MLSFTPKYYKSTEPLKCLNEAGVRKRKQLQIWAMRDQKVRCVTKEFRCGVWVVGESIMCYEGF